MYCLTTLLIYTISFWTDRAVYLSRFMNNCSTRYPEKAMGMKQTLQILGLFYCRAWSIKSFAGEIEI